MYSWGTHEGLGSAISSTAVHLCLLHLSRKKTHSEIAPPRPSSQPQLTRLPLVFLRPLTFNTSPCVSARGSEHNKSQNPKLFFFLCYTFDLCVLSIQQQVVVKRYRLLTLKAAWVIGLRTSVSGPPLTDEGAFYMGSTLNIVQVLHVGHCLWP